MNGSLIPYTPIAVDFWKIRECPQARIFFLTHLHGDHITGLTSSWSYPIYCSEITGKLLVQRYGVREELIHSLQTECAEIIYLDSERREQMTVTAIDANHCPGAVMFLMQGYFGTILHTGDFRYHSDMLNQSSLSQLSGKIDILYLDNTYCSPGCVFPTKDEATLQIIEIIEQHPTKAVLIAMRNLGKESLLCKIALHFQEWISVPDKFYRSLEIIGALDVFDNGSTQHRIRVVPFHKISNKFVRQVNQECDTIVILPTALYHGIEATPYENNDRVFVVPYSDHSSYTELRDFVSFIKPKKIIPVVKSNARGPFGLSIADRADMTCFSRYTSDGWNSKVDIPISVQAFMHCKNKVLVMEKKGKKRKAKLNQPQTKKVKRGIDYDSPKSASKENVIKGAHNSGNDKENSKKTKKDIQQVKRTLFEDEKLLENEAAKPNTPQTDSLKVLQGGGVKCPSENKKAKKLDVIVDQLKRQLKLKSRGHEADLEVEITHENSLRNMQKRKETITGVKGSPELDGEYPRQQVHKKTAIKMPLKFVSSKQDTVFDSAVGLRTYSRSSTKLLDNLNEISAFETNTVENEETTKLNETANWVLQSSEFNGKPEVISEKKAGSNKKLAGKESKLKAARHGDEKVNNSKRAKHQTKSSVSAELKQSTLSQFVTKTTKDYRVRSAAPMEEQEVYTARKLVEEQVCEDKGSRKIKSRVDLQNGDALLNEDEFDYDGEFVQNDLSRFNGNNVTGGGREQKEDTFVIVTDSEDESTEPCISKKESRQEEHAKEDMVCEHNISDLSVIAQAGTQVRMDIGFKETTKVKVNVKAKNNVVTDEMENFDHSFSILDQSKDIYTTSEKDDSEKCIAKLNGSGWTHDHLKTDKSFSGMEWQKESISVNAHENSELVEAELSNEGDSCLEADLSTVVNLGTQSSVMAIERTEGTVNNADMDIRTNLGCTEDDMSTIVNIGTQKQVRAVEETDDTVIVSDPGRQALSKSLRKSKSEVHRKYKDNCRECELDAFRQVLEQFENCKLKEPKKSQNKEKNIKQTSPRCKAEQGNNQLIKCSFTVKPVRH